MIRERLLQTVGLVLKRGVAAMRRYLREKHIFAESGKNVMFQSRLIPLYPELTKQQYYDGSRCPVCYI